MSSNLIKTDVLILGAGPAGILCATHAANRGRTTMILEHKTHAGSKLLVSGGGNCNFTNRDCSFNNYVSENPNFARSALARFNPQNTIELVEKYDLPYEERDHKQLFLRVPARNFLTALLESAQSAGVELILDTTIETIEKQQDNYIVTTNRGTFQASSLVIATGSPAWPHLGATDFGCQIAKQFGHKIIPVRPGLVPLTYPKELAETLKELTGIAIDAQVSCNKKTFRENILFTHHSLSGPAILQISNYVQPGQTIIINWLPNIDLKSHFRDLKQKKGSPTLIATLTPHLPNRFVQTFAKLYFPNKPLPECSLAQLDTVANAINAWPFTPAGTEGLNKAEVALGGVDTKDISSKTMESNLSPGLFFIGEVLDITGQLGGYNIQWALASANAAAQFV